MYCNFQVSGFAATSDPFDFVVIVCLPKKKRHRFVYRLVEFQKSTLLLWKWNVKSLRCAFCYDRVSYEFTQNTGTVPLRLFICNKEYFPISLSDFTINVLSKNLIYNVGTKEVALRRSTLLLFEGILWTLFFPLDFEGKIH